MPARSPQSSKIDLAGPLLGLFALTILALGFVFMDAFTALAPASDADHELLPGVKVVYRWQTLLGALFTPLVAVVSVWVVLRQIQENAAQEDNRLARIWRARRSLMPIVMSQVCDYAERSGARLREALAVAREEHVVVGSRIQPPTELNEGSLERIAAMIEAARSDEEADAYADLLTELQVHAARWRGFSGTGGLTPERRFPDALEDEIADAAEIYARASNLLVHARPRGHAPGAPMTRRSGILIIGLRDDHGHAVRTASMRDEVAPLTYPTKISSETGRGPAPLPRWATLPR